MKILGLSCFYHDAAAALVVDGEIAAAAQEERFTRRKHDSRYPELAIRSVLQQARMAVGDLDLVAFYEKPLLKLDRTMETFMAFAPRGVRSFIHLMQASLDQKLSVQPVLRANLGYKGKMVFPEHHMSHAASAFYPSSFPEALIVVVDGVGEWATTTVAVGRGTKIEILKQIRFPHSLGLLYSAFTYYLGFKVNSGEYKVMGLAPYGKPTYTQRILDTLVDLKPDGSYRLNMEYFAYCTGTRMINQRFEALFGVPARAPDSPITQRHMDLACSLQQVTDEVMRRVVKYGVSLTNLRRLCLGGGVALNCVANGKLLSERWVDDIWIQPAAGDAGGAVGAALAAWHQYCGAERRVCRHRDSQRGSLLGPEFTDREIADALDSVGAVYERVSPGELATRVAEVIAQGHVVGWFQGRMEFGPRALGARSILADPRSPRMQQLLNLKIKFRESFRPFAPSVLEERAAEWFDLEHDSPYMLLVASVRHDKRLPVADGNRVGLELLNEVRSRVPAVTHVDYSARIQTVRRENHPLYYDLIRAFEQRTGCPMLVNTSFNVRGEPIVCTPQDAYRCFMRTDMDCLAIGSFLLDKKGQAAREAYSIATGVMDE